MPIYPADSRSTLTAPLREDSLRLPRSTGSIIMKAAVSSFDQGRTPRKARAAHKVTTDLAPTPSAMRRGAPFSPGPGHPKAGPGAFSNRRVCEEEGSVP